MTTKTKFNTTNNDAGQLASIEGHAVPSSFPSSPRGPLSFNKEIPMEAHLKSKMKTVSTVKAEELKKRNGDVKGYRYIAIFDDGSELVIRKCSNRLHDNAFQLDKPVEFDSYKCTRGFYKGKTIESLFTSHKKHLAGEEGYKYSFDIERCNPENLDSWCFGIKPDSYWGTYRSVRTFPLSINTLTSR